MKTLIRKTCILAACTFAGLAVSCVKDGWNTCDNNLRIVYDYNIDRVDKFHVQVGFVDIFVFESESGIMADAIRLDGNPFDKDFKMVVPESLYGKKHDYLVWAGLDPGSYIFTDMRVGTSRMEDFKLAVKGYQQQLVDMMLEPLWHGTIEGIEFDNRSEHTETISLTKDTNTFRMVFSFTENGQVVHPYDPADIEVGIYSAVGSLAHDNSVSDPDNRNIHYTPYFSAKEDEAGLIYEISTLRLMADREASLVVRDTKADREVLRMPMISYLNLLRIVQESWIKDLQEYLDREDVFRILLFVDNTGGNWTSFRIMINDWVVREHGSGG